MFQRPVRSDCLPGTQFESFRDHHACFQLLFSLAFLRFLTVGPIVFDSFVRALAIAYERECFGNIASLGAVLRQSPNMWRTMLSPSF
jgi:hypothetical protein